MISQMLNKLELISYLAFLWNFMVEWGTSCVSHGVDHIYFTFFMKHYTAAVLNKRTMIR